MSAAVEPAPPRGPVPDGAVLARRCDPAQWLVLGDPAALELPAVAVVGTRAPRHLAHRAVPAAVEAAVRLGVPVAAGLAPGTDDLVHHWAAELGAATVAWAPEGLARLDPARRAVAGQVAARPGSCVVVPAAPPPASGPPAVRARNAALAAGCAVLVVAEARPRSLSLDAAACAVAAGRALVVPRAGDHHRGASAAGVRLLGGDRGATTRDLGWPAHLERYLDRYAPAAHAVCPSPALLTVAVVTAHRLSSTA